jgi:hypothetical protein
VKLTSGGSFFSKSKVDKTDSAASVTVEWERCWPGKLYQDGDGDIRCCDADEWKE